MAQLPFGALRRRANPVLRTPDDATTARLGQLLPEGVAALLLPHLRAALRCYPARDHARVLAAYGVGCLVLSDLLSQNKAIPGWREAARRALVLLVARTETDELQAPVGPDAAFAAAEDLALVEGEGRDYVAVCRMLDSAVADMADRRTTLRGSVTLRAAMARLEALAMTAAARPPLAA